MEDDYAYYEGPAPDSPNRRSFLSAALATITVAAVTGGAAALLLEDDGPPAITSDSPPTIQSAATTATTATESDAGHLQARLTALEAENSDLKNNLSAARRQLASYTGTNGANDDGGQDWRQEFEQASAQATELAGRLTAVQGLLALYEQLEALDLDGVAAEGVAALGGALGDLMAEVPLVSDGLAAGRQALNEFEEQLSLVEQGRYWLEGQMAIVGRALDAAETTLNNVLKVGGSFLQLLNRWFEDILKWLPFGIGENALAIMSALDNLLASVPETLDGLRANVAEPLDVWLERDGADNRLQRRLIKPMREKALDRADSTVGRLGDVHDVYQVRLQEPVTALAERQRLVREQIAAYRQSHSL